MSLNSLLMYSLMVQTWTARKLDKKLTRDVKEANNVDDATNAGNFNKFMLPECKELKAVQSLLGATRLWFYSSTAPWGETQGVRVGKAEEYMDLMQEFGDRKAQLEPLLDAFGLVYPAEIQKMEYTLHGMFSVADYPTWPVVRSKFSMNLSVAPLPNANDIRVLTDIPQHVRDEIEARLKEEMQGVHDHSIKHALTELMTPIAHMAKRLGEFKAGDKDAKVKTTALHASLVTNIGDMVVAAKKLNIARDSDIEMLANEARDLIDGMTSKELKDSDGFRAQTQHKAQALADRIAQFIPA